MGFGHAQMGSSSEGLLAPVGNPSANPFKDQIFWVLQVSFGVRPLGPFLAKPSAKGSWRNLDGGEKPGLVF